MNLIAKKAAIIALLTSITWPTDGWARTTTVVELQCPIGGERFTARVERSSGVQCRRFDFKRIGPVSEPPPLPECPGNGFVMFNETMSDADVKRLTPWILSNEYQATLRPHVTYYRVARIHEFLGRRADFVGWHFLQASWQVEGIDPDAYAYYARAAIDAFDRYLRAHPGVNGGDGGLGDATARLLGAELSRRLGDFAEARRRLDALLEVHAKPSGPIQLAARALRALVDHRDTDAHAATWNPDPSRCEDRLLDNSLRQ